jgi:hypothetical protein
MLAELIRANQPSIVNREPTRSPRSSCTRRRARRSGRCALERPFDEDVRAACADLPLDLVGDACALQDHVHPLRDVLVGRTLSHRHLER